LLSKTVTINSLFTTLKHGRKLEEEKMAENELLSSKITKKVQSAISDALERHRKLGEEIAIWQDDKVVILTADKIPKTSRE
jgi:hypothetical protein